MVLIHYLMYQFVCDILCGNLQAYPFPLVTCNKNEMKKEIVFKISKSDKRLKEEALEIALYITEKS